MNQIGGFFQLQKNKIIKLYHKNAYYINSGCSALKLIIKAYNIKEIFVSKFTCPVVWQSIKQSNCKCIFYDIDQNFLPLQQFNKNDFIIYNNYFGICSKQVKFLESKYKNLIIDNAQAFFMNNCGIASFYSPRKFFGVPDGGILYSRQNIELPKQKSISWNKCQHLLKRIDLSAQDSYNDYCKNQVNIGKEKILQMSNLTKFLLSNIDYSFVKQKRLQNFQFFNKHLKNKNKLKIELTKNDIPMIYPLLIQNKDLRKKLIQNKVYIAKYWPIVNHKLTEIIPLPIDQRYNTNQLSKILEFI